MNNLAEKFLRVDIFHFISTGKFVISVVFYMSAIVEHRSILLFASFLLKARPKIMDGLNENIKFEMELLNSGSLSLLDLTAKISDGTSEVSFNKKLERKKHLATLHISNSYMTSKRAFAMILEAFG